MILDRSVRASLAALLTLLMVGCDSTTAPSWPDAAVQLEVSGFDCERSPIYTPSQPNYDCDLTLDASTRDSLPEGSRWGGGTIQVRGQIGTVQVYSYREYTADELGAFFGSRDIRPGSTARAVLPTGVVGDPVLGGGRIDLLVLTPAGEIRMYYADF